MTRKNNARFGGLVRCHCRALSPGAKSLLARRGVVSSPLPGYDDAARALVQRPVSWSSSAEPSAENARLVRHGSDFSVSVLGHRDAAGAPVKFSRRIKSTADTNFDALSRRHGEHEAPARALVSGDPELDIEAAGRETGACDRVYVSHDGKPLYSATMLEVICDRDGNEIQRRPPEMIPANLVPDSAPVWSGKLLSYREAISRFAFTRAYQVRHGNTLEYDFLYGLAAHLEQGQSLVLVGSGPRGIGPLIPERNAPPMKGFLAGKTRGQAYRLVLYLAAFELRKPEVRT